MQLIVEKSPVWTPRRETLVTVGGVCVMHGGPKGMHLPEHEHTEVQIEVHFASTVRAGKRVPQPMPHYSSVISSGQPHVGRWEDGNEVIVALISKPQLEQAADELLRKSARDIIGVPCASDPVIHALAAALRREFLTGHVTDLGYVEAIGSVLAGQLVRQFSYRREERPLKGRLTPGQFRQTLEAIEHRLGSSLRVSDLAGQLGMGVHQFTSHFRETAGCTPFQFIIQCRIDRAKAMLARGEASLVDIALDLGFVSQSHFTAVFRRYVNTTPYAYRLAHQRR